MYSSVGSKGRLVTFNPDQDESAADYEQNPATALAASSSAQQRPYSRREYARMKHLQREIERQPSKEKASTSQPQLGRSPQPAPRTPLQVGCAPGPSTPSSIASSGSFAGSTPTASTSGNAQTPPTPSPVTPNQYRYPPEKDIPRQSPKDEHEDPFHSIVNIAGNARYGPGHSRSGSNTSAMEPSPITSVSTPASSTFTPFLYERPTNTVLVNITQDGDNYTSVDVTGVNGGPRIREKILSSLGYPTEYHRDFSLFKTEFGATPEMAKDRGAVSESKLLEQVHGAASNNKTTLKYYVEHNPGAPPLPAAGPSRPGPAPIQMQQPGTSPSHVAANSPEQLVSPTSAVSGGSPMPAQNGFLQQHPQQHPQHLQPQPRASPTHTSPPPLPPHPYPVHVNSLPAPPNMYYTSPPPYVEAARPSHSFGPPIDDKRAPTPQPPMSAPLQRAPRETSRPPPIQYQPNLAYAPSPAPPPGPSSGSAAHGRSVSETARRQPPVPASAPPNITHAPAVPPYDENMYAAPAGIEGYNFPQHYRPAPPIPVKTERRKVSIDGRAAEAMVRSPSPAPGVYAGPSGGANYGRLSEEQDREAIERERALERERERAERERADRQEREREKEERDRAERERQRQGTPLGTYGNGQRVDTSASVRYLPPGTAAPRIASPTGSGGSFARSLSHSKSANHLRSGTSNTSLLPIGPSPTPGSVRTQSATATSSRYGAASPAPGQASPYASRTLGAAGRPAPSAPALNTRRQPTASAYAAQPYGASSPISPERRRNGISAAPDASTPTSASTVYSDNSLTPTSSIPTPPSTLRNRPPPPFHELHTPSDTTNQRTLLRHPHVRGGRTMARTPTAPHGRRDSDVHGGSTDDSASPTSPSQGSSQTGPPTPGEDPAATASGTDEESGPERPGRSRPVRTKRSVPRAPLPPSTSGQEDISWTRFWDNERQGSSRGDDDASRTLMPPSKLGSDSSTIGASSHPSSPTPSPQQPTIQLRPATTSPNGPPVIDLPLLDIDEDDGYDDGGTLWITPPQPLPPSTPIRRPMVPPIQTEQINGRPSSSRGASPLNSAGQPSSDKGYGDWELRPQPEDVYDNLDQFFPGHDLDKPVLETASAGGKSPVDDVPPLGQAPAAGANVKDKFKHKKSIRYVANAARKQLQHGEPGEDQKTLMKRKRTTKIWGSKVEEVAPGQLLQTPSEPESPAGVGQRPTVRYTKGQLIGKGTYGRVYMGMNLLTGEMLAIKQVELPRTVSDRADGRQRLVVDAIKSESNTLKDLDHPNIVQYLGCEETEDFFNIFLEYVPGGSVGHTLRRYGRFREDVIKNITAQILDGLAYLHAMGITHRDLKADNILIDHEGNCKISDFGTSKRAQDAYADQAGATLMTGSIPWMAPEMFVAQANGYGAKVDIWSLGCVFLEMWAGERPWSQDELMQVMFKVMTNKQAPPVPDNAHLPPEAESFRLLCCAIKPEDRPTAAQLREEPYLVLPKDWKFPTPFSTISAVD